MSEVPSEGAATTAVMTEGRSPVRTLVVWCPDWPVVAASAVAGLPPQVPAAVVDVNRVVACSAVARSEGIRRGVRRRDAQARCPELVVFEDDPVRDARLFEPVAAAVEEVTPGVEVIRPGVVAVPAKGPVGYFGGEEPAAERLLDHVAARAGVECQIGIADGLFAAMLAAHRGVLVPPSGSAGFLAGLDIGELDQPAERRQRSRTDLVDLLRRLGLRTLGAFAGLSASDVASRFGTSAVLAHRLARGLEERPPSRRRPPPDLAVTESLDPPVDRVDAAAFVGRALAERFHIGLAAHELACTRLAVHARTEKGEELSRVWRCAEPLSPAGVAERVRWQLDGWLRSGSAGRLTGPSAGIDLLRLEPEEVVDAATLQLGLWHGDAEDPGEGAERAGRALVRVQGLLGPDGVLTAMLAGGRGPADQVRLVPWGDERVVRRDPAAPWPGRLPAPSPATVLVDSVRAEVLDASGVPVGVTGRYAVSAVPVLVVVANDPPRRIIGWAGPWPTDERWWEAGAGEHVGVVPGGRSGAARRRARLQVLLASYGGEHLEDPVPVVQETDWERRLARRSRSSARPDRHHRVVPDITPNGVVPNGVAPEGLPPNEVGPNLVAGDGASGQVGEERAVPVTAGLPHGGRRGGSPGDPLGGPDGAETGGKGMRWVAGSDAMPGRRPGDESEQVALLLVREGGQWLVEGVYD